jgi:hypothetical protein
MVKHIVEENFFLRFVFVVEIFWAEIYWGRLFFRAESSLIQSSCRSFIRVIVPYERGYKTSGSPLRFMLRRSSLVNFQMREHSRPCRFHIINNNNNNNTFIDLKSKH